MRDLRLIEDDALRRPDHYSQEERYTIERLRRGETVPEREKTSLLLTYMRSTKAAVATKDRVTKATTPDDSEGSFEEQDYGPTIVII